MEVRVRSGRTGSEGIVLHSRGENAFWTHEIFFFFLFAVVPPVAARKNRRAVLLPIRYPDFI